jgi:Fe-S-cluster containining protein
MADTQPQGENNYILRDHHLDYFVELRVSDQVLTSRFTRSCSTASCSARCCREGVLVDVVHRDRIIAEAALIVQHMEPAQEHDPTRWFEPNDEPDLDFPSGRAVNTNIVNGSCVFLDSRRLCVLHSAESASPGLKPFFCRAYPVAIDHGCVTLDSDWCPEDTQCCEPVEGGEMTTLEVYEPELVHMLGEAGLEELRRIAEVKPPLQREPDLLEPTLSAQGPLEG